MTEPNVYENPGIANKAEPPRDRWGRYQLPYPGNENGKQYGFQRVTTFAKVLDDPHHLNLWKQRMVTHGLTLRPDLLALAATITEPNSDDGKRELNKICEQAMEAAGAGAKANLGTSLHAYADHLLNGGDGAQIPKQFHPDLLAYRAELTRLGIEELPYWAERVIFNEHFKVSGRFDRIVKLPDGTLAIADLKTRDGELDLSMPSIVTQLATYANAGWIRNYETRQWEPMPNVRKDIALVIHLPVGKGECHVYQVNIAAGWWAARIAAEAQAWRKTKQLSAPFLPEHLPTVLEHPTPAQLNTATLPAPSVPQEATVPGASDPFAAAVVAGPEASVTAPVTAVISNGQVAVEAALAMPPSGMQPAWQPTPEQVAQAMQAGAGRQPTVAEQQDAGDPFAARKAFMADVEQGHPAFSSAQQKVIQLDNQGNEVQPSGPGRPAKQPIDPKTAGADELAELPKAKLQDLLRSLEPQANVARQRKNLAAEIVRLRDAAKSAAGQPVQETNPPADVQEFRLPAPAGGFIPNPPVQEYPNAGLPAPEYVTANPFGTPDEPAKMPRDEQFYLHAISVAVSKAELAALFDDAQTHKVPWSDALNRAGIARMQAIASGQ